MILSRSSPSLVYYLALWVYTIAFSSCTESLPPSQEADAGSRAYLLEGKNLSLKYCQTCHQYPPPELLPRHIWNDEVLPRMAAFSGIYENESRQELLEDGEARRLVLAANIYPEKALFDSMDWEKIRNYYTHDAPELLRNDSVELEVRDFFKPESPKARISPPMSTMIQYDSNSSLIYHGDVKKDYSTINIFNAQLRPVQSLAIRSPPVSIREKDGALWALLMGSFPSTDSPSGSVVKFTRKSGSDQYTSLTTVFEELQRPVDMAFADLDQDQDEDVVIAQFGNWAGRLEWFENMGNEQYERHLLIQKAGPSRVIAEDLNDDGLTDMLILFTQGDESIYAFMNQGEGSFSPKKLLQFPPTYGSVTFEYLDIDQDGRKDIIHVAGDNADYEAVLKPYHGIRIFKGLDSLAFEEAYFYPIHGAYKGLPTDFDGDGDLDIAVISFFPDYGDSAKEALMMLENKSVEDALIFEGFTLTGFDQGRWNVMDTGDINQDGSADLVLGSFVVKDPYGSQQNTSSPSQWMKDSPMLMVLENHWQE